MMKPKYIVIECINCTKIERNVCKALDRQARNGTKRVCMKNFTWFHVNDFFSFRCVSMWVILPVCYAWHSNPCCTIWLCSSSFFPSLHLSPLHLSWYGLCCCCFLLLLHRSSWDNNKLWHLIEGSTTFLRQSFLSNAILFISTTSALTSHQSHFAKVLHSLKRTRTAHYRFPSTTHTHTYTPYKMCWEWGIQKSAQQKNLVFIMTTTQKEEEKKNTFSTQIHKTFIILQILLLCHCCLLKILKVSYLILILVLSSTLKLSQCIKIIAFLCFLLSFSSSP